MQLVESAQWRLFQIKVSNQSLYSIKLSINECISDEESSQYADNRQHSLDLSYSIVLLFQAFEYSFKS